jgi:hypothetical protein
VGRRGQTKIEVTAIIKDKAIPLQASTGPEGYRGLGLPDFKTIGTRRWEGRKCSWYSFLLEADSTPGP